MLARTTHSSPNEKLMEEQAPLKPGGSCPERGGSGSRTASTANWYGCETDTVCEPGELVLLSNFVMAVYAAVASEGPRDAGV